MLDDIEKIVLDDEKMTMYENIKAYKRQKSKIKLIIGLGDMPLFYYSILSSISLTFNSYYALKLFTYFDKSLIAKGLNIEPYNNICIISFSILLFIMWFFISILCILCYKHCIKTKYEQTQKW
jgi:riboflavin transporter FmnP